MAERAAPLAELAAQARDAGRFAVDTEFMGEGRYRTLLCLVQLAVTDHVTGLRIELVDPLREDFDGGPTSSMRSPVTWSVTASCTRHSSVR